MVPWTDDAAARLTADGKRLEYRCWGPEPEKAPTLVLLHEGLGSVALWRDVPERLVKATGFGVVAYSRAGYGASEPAVLPRPITYQTHEGTVVLAEVLDALGIETCVLMGHSDGATMAAIYAGSVSDMRVRGLVLIAPHFFTEESGIQSIVNTGGLYETQNLREKLAKYHADVDNAFWGWHDAWTNTDFADWNVADVIDHWRIPCLAIQGDDDPYGTLAQIEEIATRIYSPFETRILPNCGHAPHLEWPVETDAAIADFCARLERLEREPVAFG
ncbi:alpha/beta fold hydrolase [Sulfitobacter aestuariivivens]|uniref:Alpha/beta hydrolase n=1 Tax=Sulfitobacter aestuariivivens TaxID=2766981 RepID=A0A927D5D1_9RHOB|nr:alpha/beta hydrolase [Sulfitobacter aestuariivivens]MBD3664686.1 alpha/beta hydrolase [Sulfitobacter aestuariivivens]